MATDVQINIYLLLEYEKDSSARVVQYTQYAQKGTGLLIEKYLCICLHKQEIISWTSVNKLSKHFGKSWSLKLFFNLS